MRGNLSPEQQAALDQYLSAARVHLEAMARADRLGVAMTSIGETDRLEGLFETLATHYDHAQCAAMLARAIVRLSDSGE